MGSLSKREYTEYYLAYKESADRLVSVALEEQGLYKEISIYPIAFLYRQYVELSIKNNLLKNTSTFRNNKQLRASHDLYKLWQTLLNIIRKEKMSHISVFTTEDIVNALIGADAYIAELSIIDRESMAFRYPDDKTHSKNYFPNEVAIDLNNLKERMDELANMLTFIENNLDKKGD